MSLFSTLLLLSVQPAWTSWIHRSAFPWCRSGFLTWLEGTTHRFTYNILQTKSAMSSTHPETPKRYQGHWRSDRRQSPRDHRKEGLQRGRGCCLRETTCSSSTPVHKTEDQPQTNRLLWYHTDISSSTMLLQPQLNNTKKNTWICEKTNHLNVITSVTPPPAKAGFITYLDRKIQYNAEEFHQNLKRSWLTNYVSYKFEHLRAFT